MAKSGIKSLRLQLQMAHFTRYRSMMVYLWYLEILLASAWKILCNRDHWITSRHKNSAKIYCCKADSGSTKVTSSLEKFARRGCKSIYLVEPHKVNFSILENNAWMINMFNKIMDGRQTFRLAYWWIRVFLFKKLWTIIVSLWFMAFTKRSTIGMN